MTKTLREIKLDAFRYWFEGGLSEITVGMLFLIIGLVLQAETFIPAGSLLSGISGLTSFVLVFGGIWLTRRILRSLKSRLTYPRTGYVGYRRAYPVQRILTPVIGVLITAILVWLFMTYPHASLAWVPLFRVLPWRSFL